MHDSMGIIDIEYVIAVSLLLTLPANNMLNVLWSQIVALYKARIIEASALKTRSAVESFHAKIHNRIEIEILFLKIKLRFVFWKKF